MLVMKRPSVVRQKEFATLALMVSDIGGLVAFFTIAHRVRMGFISWNLLLSWHFVWIVLLTTVTFYVLDLYTPSHLLAGHRAFVRTLIGVVIVMIIFSATVYVGAQWGTTALVGRGIAGGAFGMFLVYAVLARTVLERWTRHWERRLRWLGIGDEETLAALRRDFDKFNSPGELVCISQRRVLPLADSAAPRAEPFDPWIEVSNRLQERWSGLVVGFQSATLPAGLVKVLMHARFMGMPVFDLTDFYETTWQRVPIFHLRDGWFALAHGFDLLHSPVWFRTKRVLDLVLASIMIVVFAVPMLVIAFLVAATDGLPVIYRQVRTGQDQSEFTIFKFRTMRRNAETNGPQWAATQDTRVTRLGHILRLTRLDELPQVFNVLEGDMSFIGPRPERPFFNRKLEQTIPYYDLRHLVKPGITGWAQVNYPYGASEEDALHKLEYDLYYIKNSSLVLDLVIVLKTLRVILHRMGR